MIRNLQNYKLSQLLIYNSKNFNLRLQKTCFKFLKKRTISNFNSLIQSNKIIIRMDQQNQSGHENDKEIQKEFTKGLRNIITGDESQIRIDPYQNLQNPDSDPEDQPQPQPNSECQQSRLISKFVFVEKQFSQRGGNTPRLIVDLMVDYLRRYRSQYTSSVARFIKRSCDSLRSWHLQQRRNVYKLQHLINIFVSFPENPQQNQKKTRKICNQILRLYPIEAMKRPRSQIRNKAHYLRVMKIFSLRCRSKQLISRNQSR